ncbi:DEAD/DEAH box helicase [Hymenobacter cellulosivorans]|uniref:DEAD/DEAH box helicase n=1 Tax=Hymenobacter cellulosivorans TaxID=2932249 RepID=A0ABY4F253_9BACT|nr:DEAD/DEAH box helicase [Hymenobacter cellulosivorans]UOQ50754.1 DEAD/DEAH box helicase [Hymenobacter cellulosivorans]
MPSSPETTSAAEPGRHHYRLAGTSVAALTSADVERHGTHLPPVDYRAMAAIQPHTLTLNFGTFTGAPTLGAQPFPPVTVEQQTQGVLLTCTCPAPAGALCEHEALVLLSIVQRKELRVFFDAGQRHTLLQAAARDYGLEHATDLDAYFELTYNRTQVQVLPRQAGLFPVTATTTQELVSQLLPEERGPLAAAGSRRIVVFGRHKYYGHLTVQLAEAVLTSAGKVKNPVTVLNPLDRLGTSGNLAELKFYSGLARFQHNYDEKRSVATLQALRAIVDNPEELPVFAHNPSVSDKLTGPALTPLTLRWVPTDLHLHVSEQQEFYEVTGRLLLHDQPVDLSTAPIRFDYFVAFNQALYLLEDLAVWRVIDFFQRRNNTLLIHQSKFREFQQQVLANLEDKLRVSYSFVRPAPPELRVSNGFDQAPEKLLYLSDHGAGGVEVLPVMRYGTREVPVLSKRQLLAHDELGRPFALNRDTAAEAGFTTALLRQYPAWQEQLHQGSFDAPRALFLDEEWVLTAFEDWQRAGITILGFNQLKGNTLNPYRARISVRVTGETNWFDTKLNVRFGQQKASLRQVQQAIRNRSHYVRLDDGTRGLLPREWVEKFAEYFAAGEVEEDRIRTPSINFRLIRELYDPAALDEAARTRLATYEAAVADFTGIAAVEPPVGLLATLREYQRQGLNWLNFLDTFSFGGCLADDMGLGKTLQVLAFLLHQRQHGPRRPASLVVVSTSLVFNWQAEVEKFAPELRVHVLRGSLRRAEAAQFDAHDIVLTTYNTLVSDIRELRAYAFNYVFLDEAQAIKNPESQRYKAARLLQARNRVVLTGTPLENNTLDIYGLLSFACPGLLGSLKHFKDLYAGPIDKFKDERRARELQQRISPFVLRRTKGQVARELPDKTEMVLYCEMGTEQRRVYDACKKEYHDLLLGIHEDAPQKESIHILQGLTKLRQICNSPALLPDEADYGRASSKLDVLLEEVRSKAPQHKILIFSQFVTMLDLIRAELQAHNIPFTYLTGQTKNRATTVARFQMDDSVRVFLISLKAGGTGLNLTEADYVYLVDPWWNPAVENQAIDRSHRLGQDKKVVAVRLICPDTIEEKIMKLQDAKRELAHELIHTDATLIKNLSRDELRELFR